MPAFIRKNSGFSTTSATRISDRAAKKDPPGSMSSVPSSKSNNKNDNNNTRVSLHKRPSAMGSQYQSTCISKHYALNHKVYEAFKQNYYNLSSVVDTSHDSKTSTKSNFEWISGAFCLGYSFAETALLELPEHGYFYSNEDPNLVRLRKRSSLSALEVTKMLLRILKLMEEAKSWGGGGDSFSFSSIKIDRDDPKTLLLENNREECKRKLLALKQLAKEQTERLDTYEDKRKSFLTEWNSSRASGSNGNINNSVGRTGSWRSPVVGNHRGKRSTTKPLVDGESTATNSNSKNSGPAAPMDCEAVGETLMSCSRLFCPGAALSEADVPRSIAVTLKKNQPQSKSQSQRASPPVRSSFPKSSLVDKSNDDNSNRSDTAVFDVLIKPSTTASSRSSSRDVSLEPNKSDDAVFDSAPAVMSDDAVRHQSFPLPPKNPKIPIARKTSVQLTNTNRSYDSHSSTTTSKSSSTRSGERERKPRKKSNKKKTPNSSRSKKDSSTKNAFNKLFGKKSPPRHRSAKSGEQSELEEALYQSQLEAARVASMQSEDGEVVDPLLLQEQQLNHYKNKLNQQDPLFLQQQQLDHYNNTSSCGERDSPSSPPTFTGVPGGIVDAEDYDLQRALYLSGLEVTKPDGTSWNPQEPREYEDRHRRCDAQHHHHHRAALHEAEEEKRDDSAGESPSSPPRIRIGNNAPIVVRGVPLGATPVVVKGTPVIRSPDPFNSLQILKSCCRKDFERLRNTGKISVARVPTYQGKNEDSTNGCTVIAPLLCVRHFQNQKNETTGPCRISDDTIVTVIDTETPALLPAIRKSLGVSKNAFLIPHDAHEALIESNHMCRDQFVTVCGGNILEDCHLGALIKELSKVLPDGKKMGATFFFHQHVIAILQLRDASEKKSKAISFDVIDSLPNKATLESQTYPEASDDPKAYRNCARIFCKDASSLKATLKWYACSVFTPENEQYIDTYNWDEKLTDFDPRVFQAFLWKET